MPRDASKDNFPDVFPSFINHHPGLADGGNCPSMYTTLKTLIFDTWIQLTQIGSSSWFPGHRNGHRAGAVGWILCTAGAVPNSWHSSDHLLIAVPITVPVIVAIVHPIVQMIAYIFTLHTSYTDIICACWSFPSAAWRKLPWSTVWHMANERKQ